MYGPDVAFTAGQGGYGVEIRSKTAVPRETCPDPPRFIRSCQGAGNGVGKLSMRVTSPADLRTHNQLPRQNRQDVGA